MRILLLGLLALSLSACSLLYRLPTRQGNVIDQRDLAKLQVGMTRDQVKYVMGTPVAGNPFRDDRWDYFGYYKSPRGDVTTRTISLYFDNANRLAKMDGIEQASAGKVDELAKPDLNFVKSEEKKDAAEAVRGPRPPDDGGEQTPTPQGAP
ncbi:MAG: outer membrane protein assembly factor BamE [Hydrocarboniphaga sp.]|uniref:outer membrane protein assembly factor BamE n=1 Tax=Hydrocarboniphaga sp. TaxID=2033016 RepID=UPI002619D1C9|nr:outer membrane protein assembly factor BamE [Hydrocarboniphaga sp.]MDB5970691.1 outer membrane protein assembly factor BamE [Hydrocarboniphaga sp.]